MDIFIVRPFGVRKIKNDSGKEIDFDFNNVEKELIAPAFKALNLTGGTTGEIFAAGSIHEDMFNLLLWADIVIADITIHNANVFYELGIRHALRDKKTILIKASGFDKAPFDISGFRYIEFDGNNPSAKVDALAKTLRETIDSNRVDSPVFKTLKRLQPQDPELFLDIPVDFTEQVETAGKQLGRLTLLAAEADQFSWRLPALRLIGEKLFQFSAYDAARIVWEKIKQRCPDDIPANDRLCTIYQRLAEKEAAQNPEESEALLTLSDIAVNNLLRVIPEKENKKRAEVLALKARNAKSRWWATWKDAAESDRALTAIQSGYLKVAFELYEQGYYTNLDHYYSGINALGLLITMITLAEAFPREWALQFKRQPDADRELENLKEKRSQLEVSVQVSVQAARINAEWSGKTDIWLEITEADLACLTETRPATVELKYKNITAKLKETFHLDASFRQLKIYEQLKVLPDNVKAALKVVPDPHTKTKGNNHYLLFTGHMIDKPNRPSPRFPPAKEAAVRKRIKEVLTEEKEKTIARTPGIIKGVSGGACGGDIMFHEVCEELGIQTELYLALPRDQFIVESVEFAGQSWIERFDQLYNRLTRHILATTKELPVWLRKKEDEYSIWERNNLWELNSALVNGGINMTLIALWDGKGGDGPGGTAHMVQEAKKRGAKVVIIDINTL